MRISSQNNQFLFNFPTDLISEEVSSRITKYMEKNWIPYTDPMAYLNSTIKEIVFPSISFDGSEQISKFGKRKEHKAATNVYDTFTESLDITFRSVDSHSNYFMLQQILLEYWNNTRKHTIPDILLFVLDKDGDFLYTVAFRLSLFKSLSEVRLMYQSFDVAEQTFSLTFRFNYMDIYWDLKEVPDLEDDNILYSKTWGHSGDVIPPRRKQNKYPKK